MDKIILPMVGFKTNVLMNIRLGKYNNSNGGILMRIRKKFWIGMIICTIISWCFAFYIMRSVYN